MTQKDKDRLFEIARKLKEEKEKEELADIAHYENLLGSTKWKIFKWAAYVCALFAILMTIDILVPGNKKAVSRYSVTIHDGYVIVDDVWYLPQITEDGGGLQRFQDDSFELEYSLIFNEVKKVCWMSELWRYDRFEPAEYEPRCARSWNTIYYYFPGPSILFMIPLMVVGFKRMSPWFSFFRYACWLVIYPCAIILAAILIM